jgi:hypothetical protein
MQIRVVLRAKLILVQTGPGMLRGFSPQAMARHDARGLVREARYVSSEPKGSSPPFGSARFSTFRRNDLDRRCCT